MPKRVRQYPKLLPKQSVAAMKLAFMARSQYVALFAFASFFIFQLVGVTVFSTIAQAAVPPTVTTGSVSAITTSGATVQLSSTDLPGLTGANYEIQYGTSTSYGSSASPTMSVGRSNGFGGESLSTSGWSGRLRTSTSGGVEDSAGNFYTPAWESDDSACRIMKFSA